jgi:pectinesterase
MLKIFNNICLIIFLFIPINVFSSAWDIIVAKDGSGNFTEIQSALNSVHEDREAETIIYIKKGFYPEKLFIEKSNIILLGEDKDSTRIVFAELRSNWLKKNENDYGSAVVNIKNNTTDIAFINLTIYNNYGRLYGNNDHQFAIRGGKGVTRIIIDHCNVMADGGDTVSLWNTDDGMYYHRRSYFEGHVDYVCPRGYCFIEESNFFGHNLTASIWHDGEANKDHKFVIKNSFFDGVSNFPLGRFHREAQFYLIDCTFSANMADPEYLPGKSKSRAAVNLGG